MTTESQWFENISINNRLMKENTRLLIFKEGKQK